MAESGAAAADLDRYAEADVIHPDADGSMTWSDVQRVRAIQGFLAAGMAWEHLAAGLREGLITFDAVDAFYLEPAPFSGRSYAEFAASIGGRAVLLPRIYDTLGLPEPPADRPMRRDEEGCLVEMIDAWGAIGDEETLLRASRLLGDHTRALVEGWMALWIETVTARFGDAPVAEQQRVTRDVATRLTDVLPRLMTWAEQRYLEQAMTAVGVEQMEDAFARAGIAPAPRRSDPAVVFADLSGFSRLTEVHGDRAAMRFGTRLRDVAERVARRHGGRLVKLLGDGAMLHFDSAASALAAGRELLSRDHWPADLPLPHLGAHAGPVVERDGDIFGGTVNIAARLANVAAGGEMLVSAELASAAGALELLEPAGEHDLKNISRSISTYRLRR
jgi:adenylate cyclase